jgi:hypothetical protein
MTYKTMYSLSVCSSKSDLMLVAVLEVAAGGHMQVAKVSLLNFEW